MKTMAIVCEYNPFHNGHQYQITQQKKVLGCENVIGVMSGNFVQRGDAAICDKWTRTKMALSGGCDLVLELPVVFATQSAERFAYGAVLLIDQLKVADYLCFGSESGDLNALSNVADMLLTEDFQCVLNQALKSGDSYPKARSHALIETLGNDFLQLIQKPNNILAIEYLKALKLIKSTIKPQTITRFQAPYHSDEAHGQFASATALRKLIIEASDYKDLMPHTAYQILQEEIALGKAPVCLSQLESTLVYLLRTTPPAELKDIADVTEGLESRLIEAAKKFHTFEEISDFIKTKRYTKTRIDRILRNVLLGIKQSDLNQNPQYIRVLGWNEKGKTLLSRIKKNSPLPIITKSATAKLHSLEAQRMFELDIRATDIYAMLYPNQEFNISGWDYYISPIHNN